MVRTGDGAKVVREATDTLARSQVRGCVLHFYGSGDRVQFGQAGRAGGRDGGGHGHSSLDRAGLAGGASGRLTRRLLRT
jgi:hypothetical protein